MKANIKNCARCGNNHENMEFKKFSVNAVQDFYPDEAEMFWTHWGMCPALGEPVLLRITDTSENLSG